MKKKLKKEIKHINLFKFTLTKNGQCYSGMDMMSTTTRTPYPVTRNTENCYQHREHVINSDFASA